MLLGIAAGLTASVLLLSLVEPILLAALIFLALLVGAGLLACSGEAITVVERKPQPEVVTEEEPRLPDVVDTGPPTLPPELRPEMVEIPAGVFMMGSPEGEERRRDVEGPMHQVRISAFECMRYLVTRRFYLEVMGKDPGWPERDADERPVNKITWYDAIEFCNRLSERERLTPCYRRDGDGDTVTWDYGADGYRLLTEAEWEYACRAGTTTRWSFGGDEEELEEYAWFSSNSDSRPQPVGKKKPNPWGFHDMHGNVFEWCWDWFEPYSEDPQVDPVGPLEGRYRVLRGGAFGYGAWDLRSAGRDWSRPELRDRSFGFRCARGPRRQQPLKT